MDVSLSKLQESLLDREAWCAAGHAVTKSWTRWSNSTELRPHITLFSWGSGQQTGNPQGLWLWKSVRFDYRNSMGLEETETLLLEGTNKTVCPPGPGGRSSKPTGNWVRLALSVSGSPTEGKGWQWPAMGKGVLVAVLGDASWCKFS